MIESTQTNITNNTTHVSQLRNQLSNLQEESKISLFNWVVINGNSSDWESNDDLTYNTTTKDFTMENQGDVGNIIT